MAKQKTAYFCQSCGANSAKWIGKCPSCGEWNTYVEEVIETETKTWQKTEDTHVPASKPLKLTEISDENVLRSTLADKEFNRVLGGGLVPGSLVLIGGEPGIGKSTLLLQTAVSFTNSRVLYVSGEESAQQIKMRANRMGAKAEEFYLLSEISLPKIFNHVKSLNPHILVIDSIQTIYTDKITSAPGSISQVRECTGELMRFAKESNTPVFLIGHITKDGSLAGPKVLEHMVDTVIQFEGDQHHAYRILRTTKNRFGSTSELGIYEMTGTGLREVNNPSEILISQKDHELSGVAIAASVEGNRPLLVEIQSLVSNANYGTPQRSSTGFDTKRLNMLLAVLEKRGGFRLGTQDVFLNIAGGLKLDDTAVDLAICISLISSFNDIYISDKSCFAAEVGLGGEIRAVSRIENRIREAEKLGFKEIYISKHNLKGLNLNDFKIEIRAFSKMEQVFRELMG